MKYPELLESVGAAHAEKKRDQAGAKTVQGWEQSVKTAASKEIGKVLIVCDRGVTWWDEEVKKAVRATREAHAEYM